VCLPSFLVFHQLHELTYIHITDLEAIQQYEKMLFIEETLMDAESDVNVEEITGVSCSVMHVHTYIYVCMCIYISLATYIVNRATYVKCQNIKGYKHVANMIFMMIFQDRLSMVENLLAKLNALETNFTIVDETVPLIFPATRVRE